MCDFCNEVYPDDDINDIVFRQGKYSDFNKYIFITIDDEGKYYNINVDSGDPYEMGYLYAIKFCPYCGRSMKEAIGSESKHI